MNDSVWLGHGLTINGYSSSHWPLKKPVSLVLKRPATSRIGNLLQQNGRKLNCYFGTVPSMRMSFASTCNTGRNSRAYYSDVICASTAFFFLSITSSTKWRSLFLLNATLNNNQINSPTVPKSMLKEGSFHGFRPGVLSQIAAIIHEVNK